jgi:hypothetical protein
LWLYVTVVSLYQTPNFLGIVVDKVEQTVAVKIWKAHVNRHHMNPITRPEAKAIMHDHSSNAIYSQ